MEESLLHLGMTGTFLSGGVSTFELGFVCCRLVVSELSFGGTRHVDLEGEHDEDWGNSSDTVEPSTTN